MHHIWTKMFGYNVHPHIPTNKPGLRVADVGTGTGYAPVFGSISFYEGLG